MKTYCPVRPRNRFRSRSICAGVKAIQSTTTSNAWPARACAAPGTSSMSRVSVLTPAGRGAERRPRVASVRSIPRWAASWVHAVLMIPVPPIKRTRIQQLYQISRKLLYSWPISLIVSTFLRQAEEILDIAVAGESDAGDLAILIDRQGGMRMLDPKGWSLPALCTEYGGAAVY